MGGVRGARAAGLIAALIFGALGGAAGAQPHASSPASSPAIVSATVSVEVTVGDAAIELTVGLPAPVAWRVSVLGAAAALDLRGALSLVLPERAGVSLRAGPAGDWTRLTIAAPWPVRVDRAALDTAETPRITLRLVPDATAAPAPVAAAAPAPLHIALDPGHGGRDPGAEAAGLTEAAVMLEIAEELRAVLTAAGIAVTLTRADDGFVPLDARLTRARAAGAQVFLSLHADALPEDAGSARGATVYTFPDADGAEASRALVERHERSDLMAGIDLGGQGDALPGVLMDLARQETAPRARALADAIVAALDARGLALHPRPRRDAAFAVLRAPDLVSVLVELGFLSSPDDRARLTDAAWRAAMAAAIRDALLSWSDLAADGAADGTADAIAGEPAEAARP